MTATERSHDLDERRVEIWRLSQLLQGHRLIAEVAESEPILVVAGDSAEGHRTVNVSCNSREDDGGSLWYFIQVGEESEKPISSVGRPEDAVVAILGERIVRA